MKLRLTFLVSLILLAAIGTFRISAQQSEARVALLIGNATYADAETPLRDSITHARALADELKRSRFEVDVAENLTKEATRNAIDRFYGKIKPGSVALFFFSGYGIQSDRQTYIIPVSAQIWTEADVRRDGYSLDTILAEMNSKGAKVKIAIVDASRRNPYERRFRAVAAGLAPATAPRGTAVMYAAAPGSVIRDSDRQFFVPELIKEIGRPGKIEEAFNRTLVAVSRESRGEQAPWFSSALVEEFAFAPSGRPTTPTPQPTQPAQPAQPTPPADPDAAVRRDYQAAERDGTKKAWEDFVRKHPSGRFTDLARAQIARLDPPPVQPPPVQPPPARPPPPPDPEAEVRRDYQFAERQGTKNAWEDFVLKHPSGRYSDLARDQIAKLTPPPTKRDEPSDDPAIRELDSRIAANRNDGAAYYKRGQLYAQHGDFRRALNDFDEVLRLNPRDADALNNRCWVRAIVGELQPALRDCNEALQIRPGYLDAHDSRGFVNLKIGLPRNALADYDAALRINPKHATSLYGRGIAKLRTGSTASGNSDIAAAKAIQSDIAEEFAGYGIR
jgi:uncharacterized caspase-like protein